MMSKTLTGGSYYAHMNNGQFENLYIDDPNVPNTGIYQTVGTTDEQR